METDKNPMPNFDLFPRVERAARFIKRLVTLFPDGAPDYMSNHYRGAAAMLDHELYDRPEQMVLHYDQPEVGVGFTHTPTSVEPRPVL